MIYMCIFTARKQSLRRLCFHRCLSVHRGGLPHCMLGYTSPRQEHPHGQVHPPRQVHPPGTSPGQVHPPGRYSLPWAGTPPMQVYPLPSACWDTHPCPVHAGIHPPCTVHAGIRSTSGRYASHWNAFLY